jgi:hypothetical protein
MSIEDPQPTVVRDTTEAGIAVKASKADDAAVDTWQWDRRMVADFPQLAVLPKEQIICVNEALRGGFVSGWKSRMCLECLEYFARDSWC